MGLLTWEQAQLVGAIIGMLGTIAPAVVLLRHLKRMGVGETMIKQKVDQK